MTQLDLISFFSPIFFSFQFFSFCIFMISTSVLFGYLSYFKFFSVKKRFFLDSPKNWQISFQKNKKNIFLFFLFLCIQGIFSYYYGNILLRFILLILMGLWLFYIKKLPKVKDYLKVLKQDDVTFKSHFNSKELRFYRLFFYILCFIMILLWVFWAYLVKNPPLHYFNLNDLSVNLNDLNVRNYITMLDLVCTLITYLSIVIFFVYMSHHHRQQVLIRYWKKTEIGGYDLHICILIAWQRMHADLLDKLGTCTLQWFLWFAPQLHGGCHWPLPRLCACVWCVHWDPLLGPTGSHDFNVPQRVSDMIASTRLSPARTTGKARDDSQKKNRVSCIRQPSSQHMLLSVHSFLHI